MILGLIALVLTNAYFVRTSLYMLIGKIINLFGGGSLFLAFPLTGMSVFCLSILALKELLVRKKRRSTKYFWSIFLTVIGVLSFILYLADMKVIIGNFAYDPDPKYIIFPVACLTCLGISIFKLVKVIVSNGLDRFEREFERPLRDIKPGRRVLLGFLSFYAMYCLASLFVALMTIDNFRDSPLGWPYFPLAFLVIAYDVFFEVYDVIKSNKTMRIVTASVNFFMIVLYFVESIVDSDFMIKVAKPYALVDFAASITFLPLLTLSSLGYIAISSLIRLLSTQKATQN